MKESIPKERTGAEAVLAEAGLELTPTHLVANGYRFRLDTIVAYGPEQRTKHYRKPVLAVFSGIGCCALAFGTLGGLEESLGKAVAGLGVLLALNGILWVLMARRSPAVELVSNTGDRWRLPLPAEAMLPTVLAALDGAMGASRR